MLEIKAMLRRKDPEIETNDCVVDKVVHLSGANFDRFSRNLLRDWNFIRDNPIENSVDTDGRHHCLLVLGEGRHDGILVNSEGASYARYSAFVPNARDLYAAARYPSITELTQKLMAAADYAVSLTTIKLSKDKNSEFPNKYAVTFKALADRFGISFIADDTMKGIFIDMLRDRPEIESASYNAGMFFFNTVPCEKAVDADYGNADAMPGDTEASFAEWKDIADQNPNKWQEDKRYREHMDGTLYYVGDETGQYMRITNDGKLAVGTYELARTGTEDAVLLSRAVRQYGNFEQAFLSALQLAGRRFMEEVFQEKPSVLGQIREARMNPQPHKSVDGRSDRGGEEI